MPDVDSPFVVEHPERAGKCERREHRGHDGRLHRSTGEAARHARGEQQHDDTEHAPELEAGGQTHEGSRAQHSALARPDAREHPEQRHDRLGRMTVDERNVSQACGDGEQPDREPASGRRGRPGRARRAGARRRPPRSGTRGRPDCAPLRRTPAAGAPTAAEGRRTCPPSRPRAAAGPCGRSRRGRRNPSLDRGRRGRRPEPGRVPRAGRPANAESPSSRAISAPGGVRLREPGSRDWRPPADTSNEGYMDIERPPRTYAVRAPTPDLRRRLLAGASAGPRRRSTRSPSSSPT